MQLHIFLLYRSRDFLDFIRTEWPAQFQIEPPLNPGKTTKTILVDKKDSRIPVYPYILCYRVIRVIKMAARKIPEQTHLRESQDFTLQVVQNGDLFGVGPELHEHHFLKSCSRG